MIESQNALWRNLFAVSRIIEENDHSLGKRTAEDTRKAKPTEDEIELPQHGLSGRGTPNVPKAKPKAKSKFQAQRTKPQPPAPSFKVQGS